MAVKKCPIAGRAGCAQEKCEVWSEEYQKCGIRLLENIIKAIENVNKKEK